MKPDEPLDAEDPILDEKDRLPFLPIYNPEEDDVEEGPEDLDEEDFDEDNPRTVLITGALGNIGRKLRAAWSDQYDLVLLDTQEDPDDPEVIRADLSRIDDDWINHFHGVDTVIHLAANPDPSATWPELIPGNLDAMANVLHAAALAGAERLIFASSNHVMGGYQESGQGQIEPDMPANPDGPYGVTKLMGERMGQSLGHAFDMTFVAIRIGLVQPGENRPETLQDDWSRQLWLSNNDLIRLFDLAVEAELDETDFLVVNGMSNNRGMRWSLDSAIAFLGYEPQDDAYADPAG